MPELVLAYLGQGHGPWILHFCAGVAGLTGGAVYRHGHHDGCAYRAFVRKRPCGGCGGYCAVFVSWRQASVIRSDLPQGVILMLGL